jgi:hypothetical protein
VGAYRQTYRQRLAAARSVRGLLGRAREESIATKPMTADTAGVRFRAREGSMATKPIVAATAGCVLAHAREETTATKLMALPPSFVGGDRRCGGGGRLGACV